MFEQNTKPGIIAVLAGIVGFTAGYTLKSFLTSHVPVANLYLTPCPNKKKKKEKIVEPVTETPEAETPVNVSHRNISDDDSQLSVDTEL